ncbi:MAG: glycosyltransferase [Desulfobulbaceae bacterium]|nr:glycosyltransferase [Desulfobulbaceae bacterium]
MKHRLLVLTSTFPRWSEDTDPPFVYELSKRLAADFEVFVHTPHYPGSKTHEIVDNITVHRFRYCLAPFEKLAGSSGILPTLQRNKMFYGLLPLYLIAQFFSLLFLVYRIRPDIIHAHWIIPQGFHAVIMKMIFGVPVVVTAHGGDVYGLQSKLMNAFKRFVLEKADKVTVVSSSLKNKIRRDIFKVDIDVVSMGVSSKKFSPERRSEALIRRYKLQHRSILYVGRLSEKKGVMFLIEAMPMVLKEFPDAKLMIVGAGELQDSLHNLADNLGLQENIFFMGGVPNNDLPAYYASCQVFVGPSVTAKDGDTEGFGLTFVEAALSGCLLIGSDVGGIRDIIENNKTGFLVPEKNSRAIAEKIIYALGNSDEAGVMSQNARIKSLEKFDWEYISRQYVKLLAFSKTH